MNTMEHKETLEEHLYTKEKRRFNINYTWRSAVASSQSTSACVSPSCLVHATGGKGMAPWPVKQAR